MVSLLSIPCIYLQFLGLSCFVICYGKQYFWLNPTLHLFLGKGEKHFSDWLGFKFIGSNFKWAHCLQTLNTFCFIQKMIFFPLLHKQILLHPPTLLFHILHLFPVTMCVLCVPIFLCRRGFLKNSLSLVSSMLPSLFFSPVYKKSCYFSNPKNKQNFSDDSISLFSHYPLSLFLSL